MVVLTFFVFFLFCSTAFFFLNNKTHTPKETFVNSHYTVFKILGTEFINSALLNLEEKKNMVKIYRKKDLFCLQELFLLLLCFGDSCWLALIKKNFKKINEWNIFIFFFQIEYSWIFLFSMLTRLSLCFLLVNYFLAWCRGFIPATFYPNVNLSTRSFNMFFIYLPQKINLFTRMLMLLPNCFVCYFTYLPADSKLWPRCFFPF